MKMGCGVGWGFLVPQFICTPWSRQHQHPGRPEQAVLPGLGDALISALRFSIPRSLYSSEELAGHRVRATVLDCSQEFSS